MILSFILYLYRIAKALLTMRGAFILTPPFLKKNRVNGRNNNNIPFHFIGLDASLYRLIEEIFIEDSYNPDRFMQEKNFYSILMNNKVGEILILDIGANIGVSAIRFSQLYPDACVVAVEPNIKAIDCISKNLKFNNIENCKIVNAGISSATGKCDLVEADSSVGAQVRPNNSGIVDLVTVQDLVQDRTPFIIKIDIEGFEKDLFATNYDWFFTFPITIIELHDWMLPSRRSSSTFLKALSMIDCEVCISGENLIIFNYSALPLPDEK